MDVNHVQPPSLLPSPFSQISPRICRLGHVDYMAWHVYDLSFSGGSLWYHTSVRHINLTVDSSSVARMVQHVAETPRTFFVVKNTYMCMTLAFPVVLFGITHQYDIST